MEKGDIIKWEYDAWLIEEGKEELFDTTSEEQAKEKGIHDPNMKYGQMISIVGVDRLIKGMDEELRQAEIGKEYIVTIPPEHAYGERDPKLVKIHSYRELARQKITPEIGKEVMINNKKGRIVTVTPGRVVIDFNHPLAGKTLKYRFKITQKIEGEEDKVRAIIEMDYAKDVDNFKIDVSDAEIVIGLPDSCKYDSSWAVAKYMVVSDIREYVNNKDIKFIEIYKKKEEKSPEHQDQEKSGEKEEKNDEEKSEHVEEKQKSE